MEENVLVCHSNVFFIMSNHYGRKGLSNLLHLERYNAMFNVIADK